MTNIPASSYRTAGIASILSAVTTLGLIFLPQWFAAQPEGLPGRMLKVTDPVYRLRAWIAFLHPFLAFSAAMAVAFAARRRFPGLALGGLSGYALWAVTEAGQQALTLFAFDNWRRAWVAGDEAVRSTIALRVAIYDGIYDAAYSLLLVGIILGSIFYSVMMLRLTDRLSRLIGVFYALAAALSAFYLSRELGGPMLSESLAFWIYPASQPVARILIGLWLFRVARLGEPS